MKQLERWQVWWRAAIASGSIALGVMFDRRIEDVPLGIKFLIAVPIIALLIHGAEALLDAAFNRFQWLRKLAFGGRFIEGNWSEVVIEKLDDNTEKITSCALITIGFEDGDLCIFGAVYDADRKEPIGNFSSSAIVYDSGTLTYIYDSVLKNNPAKHHEGYGVFRFSAPRTHRQVSDSFNGYFIDPVFPRPVSIYGRKIDHQEKQGLINNEDFRDHVIRFGNEYRKQHFPEPSQNNIHDPPTRANAPTFAQVKLSDADNAQVIELKHNSETSESAT